MGCLSPATIRKYDRIEIFSKKIKSESLFQMESGELLLVINIQHNITSLQNIRNNLGYAPFIMSDGSVRTLAQFSKTDEFGGKPSSGAGSELTGKVECLQCYYNANAIDNHGYDIDLPVDDIHKNVCDTWHKSAVIIASMLANHIEHPHDYIHHKGSYTVKSIASKFSELNKKLDDPFSNINKWNPSDIWMINKEWDVNTILSRSETLQELNSHMYNNYRAGNLIGVSLKKVSKFSKITEYNTPNMTLDIEYSGFNITKSTFLNDSIDVYVHYVINGKPGRIQFRPFNVNSNWQGEVKGHEANHGKIGEKKISKFFDNRLTPSLDVNRSNRCVSHLSKFYDLAASLYEKVDTSLDEFIHKVMSGDVSDSYMLGKFKGLELISVLESDEDQNIIVDKMVRYAISASDNSSVFLKIGE
jgi:hypothetical protein